MPDFDDMVDEEDFEDEDEDDLVELPQHVKKSIPTQGSTQRTNSDSVQSKLKRPRKIGPMDCSRCGGAKTKRQGEAK